MLGAVKEIMQKQINHVEFAGVSCMLHMEQNEFGHWLLSVWKEENDQLMFDFSRKLRNPAESLALPENILVIEDNKYTDEVYLRLRNSKAVMTWIKKANLNGTPVAIMGLTEGFAAAPQTTFQGAACA